MPASNLRPIRSASLVGLWSLLAALAAGCAGGCAPVQKSPQSPAAYGAEESSGNGWGTSSEAAPAPPAPPPADAGAAPGSRAAEPAREARGEDRPGLATHWGETRSSFVRTTSFDRADSSPFAASTLWYNDRSGARSMAAGEGRGRGSFASLELAQGGVTVSLRDEGGSVLPAISSGGRLTAVGDAGSRYTIQLVNHTPARFEAVVSVDGLDVLDGREASVSKRGYILAPHATVEIDGFRRSESAVAAFRFGSVSGSYASRKGDDRNVGVVGVALFHEEGTEPWPWNDSEARRRKNAQPFPGRFAEPPPLFLLPFVLRTAGDSPSEIYAPRRALLCEAALPWPPTLTPRSSPRSSTTWAPSWCSPGPARARPASSQSASRASSSAARPPGLSWR